MSIAINLQDVFLNQIRKDKTVVIIYLTNGVQMKGIVRGFDTYVVIFEADGKHRTVFKHAISTISPTRRMQLMMEER